MLKVLVFAIVSILLVVLSRRSLRRPRAHGFYRFFAWECLLALVLLNYGSWFRDPLSWNQVVSWFLLVDSLVLVGLGTAKLWKGGGHEPGRSDAALFTFEKTAKLVTDGVYGYIRHPLYGSLLFLAWGVYFKDPSWPGLPLSGAATALLLRTAMLDEAECLAYFGAAYADYMTGTKRFVPFVF